MGVPRGQVPPREWHLNPFPPADDARPGSSAGPTGKDKDKALPSFWIPSLTPEAKATKLEKPVSIPAPCAHLGPEGQNPPGVPSCLGTPPPFFPTPGPSPAC